MRFSGIIGFAGGRVEDPPGVWKETPIVERSYFGDVIRNSRQLQGDQQVNPNVTVGNSISIVADALANENFMNIRYVGWMGSLWTVENVDVQAPRLILRLGGVYNGPTA
jgi:hypothetical protein